MYAQSFDMRSNLFACSAGFIVKREQRMTDFLGHSSTSEVASSITNNFATLSGATDSQTLLFFIPITEYFKNNNIMTKRMTTIRTLTVRLAMTLVLALLTAMAT